MSQRRTHLYRLWNAEGELLYVGISKSAMSRLTQHQHDKAWADEIASVTVEHVATRAEAERLEVEAIKSERPKYNIRNRQKPTRQEQIDEQWASLTTEQRREAKEQLSAIAAALFDLEGNSQRGERIAAYTALYAARINPASIQAPRLIVDQAADI